MIRGLVSENDINKFIEYEVESIDYHLTYSRLFKIKDRDLEKYDVKKTYKRMKKKGIYQCLIIFNSADVGILEYSISYSKIDNQKHLFINNLYIDENYRNHHIASKLINYLRKLYGIRIELECWYELPAYHLYESLGMKKIITRYFYF